MNIIEPQGSFSAKYPAEQMEEVFRIPLTGSTTIQPAASPQAAYWPTTQRSNE
ncbi:MAG TPA: hypothetical protein VL307_14865 [Chitinophagaceae bacterium]|nr:hypothetical protein [Chitinophagaceae bacterium]